MDKLGQEILDIVMELVSYSHDHRVDKQKLEDPISMIINSIEDLAIEIEKGEYDLTYEDMKAISEIGKEGI